MVCPGLIRLYVLDEFITTCPCFDLIDAPTTDSSGWRIHGSIRSSNQPMRRPMHQQLHRQVHWCILNVPTSPPSSPPTTNQSIIFPSSQCELNTSIMLFMFLLLTCLFLLVWCFNNWLFWSGVDGVQ